MKRIVQYEDVRNPDDQLRLLGLIIRHLGYLIVEETSNGETVYHLYNHLKARREGLI